MRLGKLLLFLLLSTCACFSGCMCFSGCRSSMPCPDAPKPRVISHSPALTEMMFDMGLGDHVVAVTTQCILPEGENRIAVGDLNEVNAEAILTAVPDVILIQQNPKKFDSVLEVRPEIKIEHFDIEEIDQIASAMERIGEIVNEPEVGKRKAAEFRRRLDAVRRKVAGLPKPKVLFVMMSGQGFFIGGEKSFIKEIIELAGGVDAAGEFRRWAGVNIEHILQMQPEVIICQTDPGMEDDAKEYWQGIGGLPAVRNGRVYVVTDRHWTIPSTRTVGIAEQAAAFIHPEAPHGGDN